MAWRDVVLDQARFRGVPFFVERHQLGGGRRLAVFEFPLRDVPQVEDLGRRGRRYNLVAYVIGPDYHLQRDLLLDELEAAGRGTLSHPYLGEQLVAVEEFTLEETTREGGMARFQIAFVQAAPIVYPAATVATATAATAAAEATSAAAVVAFEAGFSVAQTADWVRQQAAAQVRQVVSTVSTVTRRISQSVDAAQSLADDLREVSLAASELILTPAVLAAQIESLVRQVGASAQIPIQALAVLDDVIASRVSGETGSDTPSQQAATRNASAFDQLVGAAGLAALCRTAAAVPAAAGGWESSNQALARRDALIEQVDSLTERITDDALYSALVTLRADTARDLTQRAAELPAVVQRVLPQAQPALALAWTLYGDALRGDEIVRRNPVHARDPLALASGVALEVLSA